MSRVNTDVNLDPDFGRIVPPIDSYYWVSVTPPDKLPYRFILLMPIIEDDELFEDYIHFVMEQLVEAGSSTIVEPVDVDAFDKVSKSTYVASFDPNNPDVYFWLTPPIQFRH